jgi:hypothetical protein
MPKSDLALASGDYAPVADRITLFYQRFPAGRIVTDLVSRAGGEVVFKASVFREPDDVAPAATGWAAEREGDGDVNAVACLENTETSAIGRALANLGFTASARRPSAEEMEKAARARARLGHEGARVAGTERSSRPRDSRQEWHERQRRADVVTDTLTLIRSAEQHGMRRRRAEAIASRLLGGTMSEQDVARIAQRLRRWLRKGVLRTAQPLPPTPADVPQTAAARPDVTTRR